MSDHYTVLVYRPGTDNSYSRFEFMDFDNLGIKFINYISSIKFADMIRHSDIAAHEITILVNGRKDSDNKKVNIALDEISIDVEKKYKKYLEDLAKMEIQTEKKQREAREADQWKIYQMLKEKFKDKEEQKCQN